MVVFVHSVDGLLFMCGLNSFRVQARSRNLNLYGMHETLRGAVLREVLCGVVAKTINSVMDAPITCVTATNI